MFKKANEFDLPGFEGISKNYKDSETNIKQPQPLITEESRSATKIQTDEEISSKIFY